MNGRDVECNTKRMRCNALLSLWCIDDTLSSFLPTVVFKSVMKNELILRPASKKLKRWKSKKSKKADRSGY